MSQLRNNDQTSALLLRKSKSGCASLQFRVNGALVSTSVFQAAHPNRPIRLTVGKPGARSSIWRIWANPGSSDIYIASRHTAGHHKISLHQSGDYRYQLINFDTLNQQLSDFEVVGERPEGRMLGSWRRPQPQPHGWTDAMRIVVPSSELFETPTTVDSCKDAGSACATRTSGRDSHFCRET